MFNINLKQSIIIFIGVAVIAALFDVSGLLLGYGMKLLLTFLIINGIVKMLKKKD